MDRDSSFCREAAILHPSFNSYLGSVLQQAYPFGNDLLACRQAGMHDVEFLLVERRHLQAGSLCLAMLYAIGKDLVLQLVGGALRDGQRAVQPLRDEHVARPAARAAATLAVAVWRAAW